MKLYATVTSERASKGQGGNEYITIDLLIGSRDEQINAGRITMKTTGDVFWIDYFNPHTPGESVKQTQLFSYEKGKKQKDEKHEGQHEQCDKCMKYVCTHE